MGYSPQAVKIDNNQDVNGSCFVSWLYPNTDPAVQSQQPVASEAGVTLPPPGNGPSGSSVVAAFIYNAGPAVLNASLHNP
jgi:hypothetical protein